MRECGLSPLSLLIIGQRSDKDCLLGNGVGGGSRGRGITWWQVGRKRKIGGSSQCKHATGVERCLQVDVWLVKLYISELLKLCVISPNENQINIIQCTNKCWMTTAYLFRLYTQSESQSVRGLIRFVCISCDFIYVIHAALCLGFQMINLTF